MSELTIAFKGKSTGGEINLSRYPNLAYTPVKGVHTHLAGIPVSDVARAAQSTGIVEALDAAVAASGLSLDELCDALRYARANRLI